MTRPCFVGAFNKRKKTISMMILTTNVSANSGDTMPTNMPRPIISKKEKKQANIPNPNPPATFPPLRFRAPSLNNAYTPDHRPITAIVHIDNQIVMNRTIIRASFPYRYPLQMSKTYIASTPGQ